MTTRQEKQCLDLIFAALDGMALGLETEAAAYAKKLQIVLGLAVYLATEIGLDEAEVIVALHIRFLEYQRSHQPGEMMQ